MNTGKMNRYIGSFIFIATYFLFSFAPAKAANEHTIVVSPQAPEMLLM